MLLVDCRVTVTHHCRAVNVVMLNRRGWVNFVNPWTWLHCWLQIK